MAHSESWDSWKDTLGKAVDIGETVGLSDETITNIAERVGTYMSNHVDPRNHEERLLKELWDVADDGERKTLARLVTKVVDE